MDHHFTTLVGKLSGILRDKPETRLSEKQANYLTELRLEYQTMRGQFAQKLGRGDALVEAYVKCFDLSIGCLHLLQRVFDSSPGGQARATYLAAFSLEMADLEGLLHHTEAATAVRYAEGYVSGRTGETP